MPDPVELLQTLIRFDTTNPPGGERAAVEHIAALIEDAGVEVTTIAKDPGRPNLVARITGRGEAPGLLLQGHVDVVPTTGQQWSRDPFSGDIVDGFVWGRGALDMKGGVAMMLAAFIDLAERGEQPAGDIVLAIVSDEEDGGTFGARFLVDEHPGLLAGVGYAVGEFGGFPLNFGGSRFYPVQVAERVPVPMRLTVRGPGGHGSLPMKGGAMAKAARVLGRLERRRLPVHIVPATRLMLEGMAEHLDGTSKAIVQRLVNPAMAAAALKALPSKLGVMEPVFRNTVNATVIRGGGPINVIPSTVEITLDGRMLPGRDAADFADEVKAIVGRDVEIDFAVEGATTTTEPNMDLFPLLADVIREMDPDGHPIPFLMPAVTDGRWFACLGIQPYGFLPMVLPDDFVFQSLTHAADERIPVAAVRAGTEAMRRLLRRYPG
jgi:acetylornithine deacetylase/succinyl-diaminopimelate desuccinylase-like protein